MLIVNTTMLERLNIKRCMLRGINHIISLLKLLSGISNQRNTSNSSFFPSFVCCGCYKTYCRYNINQIKNQTILYRPEYDGNRAKTKQTDATRSNLLIISVFIFKNYITSEKPTIKQCRKGRHLTVWL